jgi:hypothetical protein
VLGGCIAAAQRVDERAGQQRYCAQEKIHV